jgi:hypothetical protein
MANNANTKHTTLPKKKLVTVSTQVIEFTE